MTIIIKNTHPFIVQEIKKKNIHCLTFLYSHTIKKKKKTHNETEYKLDVQRKKWSKKQNRNENLKRTILQENIKSDELNVQCMQATKNERWNTATTTPSCSLSLHVVRYQSTSIATRHAFGYMWPAEIWTQRPSARGPLSQMDAFHKPYVRTTMSRPNSMRNNDMVLKLKSK